MNTSIALRAFRNPFHRVLPAVLVLAAALLASPANAGGYKPAVALLEARESFSTPPAPFILTAQWSVEKGFVERIDVEVNGSRVGSHQVPGGAPAGTMPLRFDGAKLGPGDHRVRIVAWQGEGKHRATSGTTKTVRVLVVAAAPAP